MITIMISDNENKAKEALLKLLQQEGYCLSDHSEGENTIRLVKQDCMREADFIKDKVIELGDSLYDEKKGKLYQSVVEAIERPLIEHTLRRTEGNQFKAARILGINRNTMRAKLKKLGINSREYKI